MELTELLERLRSTRAQCMQKADVIALTMEATEETSKEEYRWMLAAYRLDSYLKVLHYLASRERA